LVQLEIAPFDPPTPKALLYRAKHEVGRMTHFGDIAIRKFPNEKSVNRRIGAQSTLGEDDILPEKYDEKLSECPNFT